MRSPCPARHSCGPGVCGRVIEIDGWRRTRTAMGRNDGRLSYGKTGIWRRLHWKQAAEEAARRAGCVAILKTRSRMPDPGRWSMLLTGCIPALAQLRVLPSADAHRSSKPRATYVFSESVRSSRLNPASGGASSSQDQNSSDRSRSGGEGRMTGGGVTGMA